MAAAVNWREGLMIPVGKKEHGTHGRNFIDVLRVSIFTRFRVHIEGFILVHCAQLWDWCLSLSHLQDALMLFVLLPFIAMLMAFEAMYWHYGEAYIAAMSIIVFVHQVATAVNDFREKDTLRVLV